MFIAFSLCHFRVSFYYCVNAFFPFADIINDLKLKEQCVYQRCKWTKALHSKVITPMHIISDTPGF